MALYHKGSLKISLDHYNSGVGTYQYRDLGELKLYSKWNLKT